MIRPTILLMLSLLALEAAPPAIQLPTENHHLLTNEPEKFYMYVDRTFEGAVTKPWEGGTFGFVRTPIRINGEMVLTHFHEGIDIAPVKRDRAGNPLDLVSSLADGTVVHISPLPGRSNYGRYVVVEHRWENSAIYSLYAHLAEITVQPGDPVKLGAVLGRMGYSGAGIDRTRAHLHLELGLMTSARYEDWHRLHGAGTNYHGNFNGMNFIGTEVSRFFLARQQKPELAFSQFVATTPVYFKVTVPAHGLPEFVTRYPWLLQGKPEGAVSWEISFSATGQPVAVAPCQTRVEAPIITAVRPSNIPHRYLTRNLVTGTGNKASLTHAGLNLVALLVGDFPAAPADSASAPATSAANP